jgi:hypothetical protein
MTNTKSKRKPADAYYLLDSKLCIEWKHYIQEKIKDCPRNYATDVDLHELLKKGKILKHKEDFYLVAEGEQWNKFSKYFICGVILKFTPSYDNKIDYNFVEDLAAKYENKNKELPEMSSQIKSVNEYQLLPNHVQQNLFGGPKTPPKQGRNRFESPKFVISNDQRADKNWKFTDNDVSRPSVNDSIDNSTYEPEFLKNTDQTGHGVFTDDDDDVVTPSNRRKGRGMKKHKTSRMNLTPNAHDVDNLNTSFLQPQVERLNILKRGDKNVESRSFIGGDNTSQTPRPQENIFERTFNRIDVNLLIDGKGRALERASDASDTPYNDRGYHTNNRAESPRKYEQNKDNMDYYNIVGLENPRFD